MPLNLRYMVGVHALPVVCTGNGSGGLVLHLRGAPAHPRLPPRRGRGLAARADWPWTREGAAPARPAGAALPGQVPGPPAINIRPGPAPRRPPRAPRPRHLHPPLPHVRLRSRPQDGPPRACTGRRHLRRQAAGGRPRPHLLGRGTRHRILLLRALLAPRPPEPRHGGAQPDPRRTLRAGKKVGVRRPSVQPTHGARAAGAGGPDGEAATAARHVRASRVHVLRRSARARGAGRGGGAAAPGAPLPHRLPSLRLLPGGHQEALREALGVASRGAPEAGGGVRPAHPRQARRRQPPPCYAESLLSVRVADEGGRHLTDAEMVSLCSEFLNGGTDITVTLLEWIMAELVRRPDVQAKVYEEVKANPELNDLQAMPYLKATVLEGLRLHPPGHFLLPHGVQQSGDAEIGGCTVPKGADVIFVVAELGRDETLWTAAREFRPERFLEGAEGHGVDITGRREIKMMPFGAGRRMCPGYSLGMHHAEYFVARMVRELEWRPPVDGEEVDMAEVLDFTTVMKHPLRARVVART